MAYQKLADIILLSFRLFQRKPLKQEKTKYKALYQNISFFTLYFFTKKNMKDIMTTLPFAFKYAPSLFWYKMKEETISIFFLFIKSESVKKIKILLQCAHYNNDFPYYSGGP